MIRKLGCVEIPVSNMQKSTSFYEKVLGLKKTYEHPVWTSFDIGGVSFALAAAGTKRSEKGTETCNSCSLCIFRYIARKIKQGEDEPSATSVIYLEIDNLDEFYSKLKSQGVTFIAEPKEQGWGGRTAVMLDPDSNIIVLSEA